MLSTVIVQTLWSLPFSAVAYFPPNKVDQVRERTCNAQQTCKPGRVAGLVILILLPLTVYLVALSKLQIIEGEANYNRSSELTNTERVVTAARGNIYDRYGRILVSNEGDLQPEDRYGQALCKR